MPKCGPRIWRTKVQTILRTREAVRQDSTPVSGRRKWLVLRCPQLIEATIPDDAADRPQDLVERNFTATRPNQLWMADGTYVATWRRFVYVAIVIDVFARRVVRSRVAQTLRTDPLVDALERALCDRPLGSAPGLVLHSDRGVQYLSIR